MTKKLNYFHTKNKKAYKLYQAGLHNKAENSLIISIRKYNSKSDFDLNLLGVIHYQSQRYESAIGLFLKAISLNNQDANYFNNLGAVYKDTSQIDSAINAFSAAIQLDQTHAEALYNLGSTYQLIGDFDKAELLLFESIKCKPDFTIAKNNLACLQLDRGKIEDAIYLFDEIIEQEPENYDIMSNRLFAMNYLPLPDDFLFQEHLNYAKTVSSKISQTNQQNLKYNNNKIRIGYISADFRLHSVSYFAYPLIKFHDRSKFEVFCYADILQEDLVTSLYKQNSNFLHTLSYNNKDLLNKIQEDKIDILVDLSGHSARNRLPLFAQRAAYNQITYLGYPNTTGLSQMDYRFVDSYTDPMSLSPENYHTEKLIYLDDIFLAYYPGYKTISVTEPPSIRNKYITYGSFNNRAKINTHTLNSWASILLADHNSKLILKSSINSDEYLKNNILNEFEARNVNPSRIKISPYLNFEEHLKLYQQIDIALDTYPYNGTTTTCESLWSGVPVITQIGQSHRSRVSGAILSQLGLGGCVTIDQESYISTAIKLAHNANFLNMWRAKHKTQMEKSNLMNYQKLINNIEENYIKIYRGEV